MTNTYSPELNDKIEEIRQDTYERLYKYNFDLSKEAVSYQYKGELQKSLKNVVEKVTSQLLQFPNDDFCNQIEKDNADFRAEMEGSFANADLMTYPMRGVYHEPERANNVNSIFFRLEDQCKQLASKVAPLSLDNNYNLALFSDGTLFVSSAVTKLKIERLQALAKKHGISDTRVQEIDRYKIASINAYARFYYQDESFVKPLKPLAEFLAELFADDSICLTSAKGVCVHPEVCDFSALFDNGRLLFSKEARLIPEARDIMQKTCRYFENTRIILQREIVPQSYIDAIYAHAKTKTWYIGENEQLKQFEDDKEAFAKTRIAKTSDEIAKMNLYVENLTNNNNNVCLTSESSKLLEYVDKNQFAFFEDGRLIINEKCKVNSVVLSAEVFLSRKRPDLEIKKEYVSLDYLNAIYKALPKPAKDEPQIALEMLKHKAKKLGKCESIPHHEALEIVAKLNRFNNWKEATQMSEANAKFMIACFKQKDGIMDAFILDAMSVRIDEQIEIEEAREIFAKRVGLSSWARLEAISLSKASDIYESIKSK